MSVIIKNSARLRDEARSRLVWLLTTDKNITLSLLGKLIITEQHDNFINLTKNISEVSILASNLPPPDIADTLEALPSEERCALWKLIKYYKRGRVLLEASENVWEDLIKEMSDHDIFETLKTLDIDEQIYLVQNLPRNLIDRLLISLPVNDRLLVSQIMYYKEGSVGAIMEFEVITVSPDMKLGTVQRYLRRYGKIPENTDKIFVISNDKVLLGELLLQNILLNSTHKLVKEIMDQEPIIFSPEDDAEKAARTFERYNLISAAVVDSSGKLIGRVTIDEIINVVYEENDNDFRAMGGISIEEDIYAPVSKAIRTRWAWLAINLCTTFIASRVINSFEYTISKFVALASLMPIVAGIGGNTGNQTITMIVRALALQNIQFSNFTFLILRETGVALINGILLGSIMGSVTWLLYNDLILSGIMMLAMVFNLLTAAIMGVIIPMAMTKMGYDPAVGSNVMITAITDSCGFFIFLGLATIFLL